MDIHRPYPAETTNVAIAALSTDILGIVSAYFRNTKFMKLVLIVAAFFFILMFVAIIALAFMPGNVDVPIVFLVLRGLCIATGIEWRFAIIRSNDFRGSATVIGMPIVGLIAGFKLLWSKIRQIGRRREPMNSQDVEQGA